jgi:hypothetical protein
VDMATAVAVVVVAASTRSGNQIQSLTYKPSS